ncbi:MAG: alanine--tRNA ligase [Candidatus Lokiarchaeota archaeon]|nr:alanine--tRNA ligase [Candidatus Lokiarchaeota archaeon]
MLTEDQVELLSKSSSDKETKKIFQIIASKEPELYFPTKELKELGYMRKTCNCGTNFWTTHEDREVCGDPVCSGGFQVVINNPSPVKLSYINVWKKIVEVLEPRGYLPVKRYPCVARWNSTSEFTIASISAFQPYVVSGEVDPPAKKLLIPQFCLRFNDIPNVGLTGSHACGFVMIGQHAFVSPDEWNQGQLFMDMHDFITEKGVGLSKEEITIHEDSWAGGGTFGCSLEFFSRGVELFNQVYMMFEQTPDGPRELKLKVLDMGLGQERVAWFSQGTPNMYEAVFPQVLKKLREKTSIELDLNLYEKFSRYAAYLNVDEVEDMDAAWKRVANELSIKAEDLKEKILPMTGLYSIAEHARSLLFAINDGKLPSNVGGGYNLRVIFRRALSFIDQFEWEIDMADVCEWHAEELREIFPEVSEHLEEIREILDVEKEKFYITKEKASKILEKIVQKGDISLETLVEIYDSNGINPEMVKSIAKKYNKKVIIPDNFYSLVVERHEKVEQAHATRKDTGLNLEGIPETKSLFYDDYTKISNQAKVLKIVNKMIVLDKSVAYGTSGGQLHDIGTLNGQEFVDVIKQGNHIIHVLQDTPKFKEGDVVKVNVDKDWRFQLSQHHTATHIVNAAAKQVLGNHVNQAGAKKTVKNAHLDITHYEQISKDKLELIEEKANEIVNAKINLKLSFMPRTQAEQKYGMGLYQGGAVPGKNIRVVEVPGVDVEACGGTHLNNTHEAGHIKILKSQKIQDGVVRLVFTAGNATLKVEEDQAKILEELQNILSVDSNKLVGRIIELLEKRNNLNKALKKGKIDKNDLKLNSKELINENILAEIAQFLNVKENKISSKVRKLYEEWNRAVKKVETIEHMLTEEYLLELIENAQQFKNCMLIIRSFEDINQNDIKNLSQRVMKKGDNFISIFVYSSDKGVGVLGMSGKEVVNLLKFEMGSFINNLMSKFGGKGGGNQDYGQGFITNPDAKLDDVLRYINEYFK